MALLWQKTVLKTWDYLGKKDESFSFQGNAHKSQALKFSQAIMKQRKQILFFYGEVGSGKTRLAKETARQLASQINENCPQPLLNLFLIDCGIFEKEGSLEIAEIQSQFVQTLKAFDNNFSDEVSKCKPHEFFTNLSNYLEKRKQIFLFLLDGIVSNVRVILTFIENLISTNENVLLFVTSPTHLEIPRLMPKVSSYTCAGLTPEAGRTLLNEVAGHLPELAQFDEEIVSLCHMNPFLIINVGLQMRNDSNFRYSAKEIRDLLDHSVALAVSGGNVPEKDNIFERELELTRKLTRDMGRKVVHVLNQAEHTFSAIPLVEALKVPTPAVLKKAYLQSLVSSSILSQESGDLFSLSELFTKFFKDQRILVNRNLDDFVEKIYEELKRCLGDVLSSCGVEKMFMVHQSDMDHIRSVERRITGSHTDGHLVKKLGRRHFIDVCAKFLENIPLDGDKISEFRENCIVILNIFERDEQAIINTSNSDFDISDRLNDLVISDQAARKAYFERKQDLLQTKWKEGTECLTHPSDEEPSVTRFGVQTASPTSRVSGFSSLASSDDSVRVLTSHEAHEASTMPYKDTDGVQYFPLEHFDFGNLPERPSAEPEEVSFHEPSFQKQGGLTANSPYQRNLSSSQPQEVSFHDVSFPGEETGTAEEQSWPGPVDMEDHNGWSLEGNPPTIT